MKAKTNNARSWTSGSSQKKHPLHDKKDQRQVELDHESLANAEEVARIGSWKWDLHSKKVTWSDGMFRLFGVDRETFDGDVERIIADRILP